MTQWKPDPSFYPSPSEAMKAPDERVAYVALLNPAKDRPDALGVVDLAEGSPTYGRLVGQVDMTGIGDELHHFGWNACSSCLSPYAPHAHVERRYLVVPGIHSSRIHVIDTKEPLRPRIVKVVEAEEIAARTGYKAPHTVHCGPDGIYVSALGNADGAAPGGIFVLDHETFEPLGRWEVERGDQELHYDFWWHLGYDTLITSEWGTPNMVEGGLDPELLMGRRYGHRLHLWDLRRRRLTQTLDLGDEHQIVLELRPAHDPTKDFGFVNVVVNVTDLTSSIWTWHSTADGSWAVEKTIEIPPEAAETDQLPPALQPFGAAPPLVSDIALSLDDRFLYVSCWGTGELRQYDVTDPLKPEQVGSIRIGGMVERTPHPAHPDRPLNGAPQMVEVSRGGKRVYFTNSLYASWDEQFYPDGITSWMVKADVKPDGGIELDKDFFVDFSADGRRAHQVRLEGGDASSDSFCYP